MYILTVKSQKRIPSRLSLLTRSPFNSELGIHKHPITLLDILHPIHAPVTKDIELVVGSGGGSSLSVLGRTASGWVRGGDGVSDVIFSVFCSFEFRVCGETTENLHTREVAGDGGGGESLQVPPIPRDAGGMGEERGYEEEKTTSSIRMRKT